METVLRAGRSLGSGVCRAAGALARGTRRILAAVPLLGITAAPVAVQETDLPTGGEEAENTTAAASGSPTDEKSTVSSPSADEQVAAAAPVAAAAASTPAEAKEEAAVTASPAAASPAEEKKEEPTPSAPTPVPSAEDKKEEAVVEKVEAEKKVVEVSPAAGGRSADPIEVPVFRVQPVATPSIIERKTSEDLPSLPPSSPPPTPIDPSPLQQARQAAASATALAEALKLPAEAAADEEEEEESAADVFPSSPREYDSQESRVKPAASSPVSSGPFSTFVPAEVVVECPPVVEIESRDRVAEKVETFASSRDNERGEIDPKVESVPESPAEEACERGGEEGTTPRVADTRDDGPLAECRPGSQDPLVNVEGGVEDARDESGISASPEVVRPTTDRGEAAELSVVMKVPGATDKVVNETLVVECQIKSEINNGGDDAAKTNVSADAGGCNENAAVVVAPPAEIKTNSPSATRRLEETAETENAAGDAAPMGPLEEKRSVDEETERPCGRAAVEPEHNYARDAPREAGEEGATVPVASEEPVDPEGVGLLPSDETVLVEAKVAVVIPEDDSVEELTDTTESVKAIPETDEERIENEPESDTALPTEETLISEELEDAPSIDAKTTSEDDVLPPPPLSEDAALFGAGSLAVKEDPATAELATASSLARIEQIEETESYLRATPPDGESCLLSSPEPTHCSSEFPDPPTEFPSLEVGESQSSEPQMSSPPPSFPLENIPEAMPPSFDDPQSYIPNAFEHDPASPRDPTETLLTPPSSPPASQSCANPVASGIAASAKDRPPQTLSHDGDDRSNRESQTTTTTGSSVSAPTPSDVELKERLAAKCLAETECQEEALSCQLSTAVLSAAAQEHHQSAAPEVEAPVENNVAHDTSTTDCNDEPPKVAPPAVPTEAPASPPTAPAITEDVASVTKAIEEIDISDKAVAAAVNEAIECNTNEIIADAHHQNNINEYE
ncbi:PREDICTED: proteoglycan 4-like isoform X2 [Dinoponera quadriceps]|uniref:Proteoglycan 4-like isoform X2 n=1 Tax=Dinoponera quadriceps TaxID=609295 RepID=A0A6P3WPQ2_DINQU|nr:PREDICTED: proteoglycan 4-like isoform X2 [Dinoponera quadriceps]XP_014468119.1 PREDICTED: proteoglycan 4-like isoform X2 [Dinoponera quadriceps]XP_014468120.1 PREDICTED: proteoglycan 4-like isoform X2 [Dinoponera quadriceps]